MSQDINLPESDWWAVFSGNALYGVYSDPVDAQITIDVLPKAVGPVALYTADQLRAAVLADRDGREPLLARSLAEWHEEDGTAIWWAWCGHEWAGEPAWIGSPLCEDWPGYHTHWTPHPKFPADAQRDKEPNDGN